LQVREPLQRLGSRLFFECSDLPHEPEVRGLVHAPRLMDGPGRLPEPIANRLHPSEASLCPTLRLTLIDQTGALPTRERPLVDVQPTRQASAPLTRTLKPPSPSAEIARRRLGSHHELATAGLEP